VRFFGRLPRDRIVDLHQGADVALVTFLHAPVFHENSPNKAFDALAAGLPVLFNRSTWMQDDLAGYACGHVCQNDPPAEEMAAVLKKWAGNPALRRRMREGARRLVAEQFDRDRLAAGYLDILEKGLRRGRGEVSSEQ
jgi:glycosyltransferase involved in cell wall biosynthesis